jgi:hypothetical protein
MAYKQQVSELQNKIIKDIKQFVKELEELGGGELHFKEMFQVWITESDLSDSGYIRVSYTAVGLLGESVLCNSETDEQEIQLGELDIYELAHIMDMLKTNQFETI